ncbi:hypothetical protein DYB32_000628 [Aphanomyces invadans]|uniref:Protein kinase domain-containing protein n=1 Tax=Aphanomyces invadans TaxID=157072 RepID=A0A418B9B8_9STRA|nr:hypothetical protein DYB32_000628 [Aphanomyces invadans]
MGQVASWCLGDEEHEHALTPFKEDKASTRTAAPNTTAQSAGSDQNEQSEIYRSRPKPIMASGPMYAAGTFESKYTLKAVIGNGSTSVCHLCEENTTKKQFACKVIDKRAIQSKSDDLLEQFQVHVVCTGDAAMLTCLEVEIQVLQSLDHPNIIHMEDVYQTDSRICMVTELMEGGELFDYVVQKGYIQNVLLTSPSPNAEIKIIDFGLAKLLHNSQTRSFLGTRAKFGLRFPRWASGLSESAKDLLRHLLGTLQGRVHAWALTTGAEVDSDKRYTAEQACLHPWVTGQRTPNKFLESPNYLKSIKQRHQAVVANAAASQTTDNSTVLRDRRLSH